MDPKDFPKINVIGASGSGKSTFSRKLAQMLNSPYVEMDRIFWGPNWHWPTDAEFFEKLKRELNQESWVLDGNYSRTVPIKWQYVNMVVWLDYSFFTTLYRAVRRAILRSLSKEEIWSGTGNRETFRKSFLSKDSIILWTIKTHGHFKARFEVYAKDSKYSHIQFVRISSDQQAKKFLANMNYNWHPLSVEELTKTMHGISCEWAVAGGWAIDLFLDKVTRPHEDIDIIIKREDQFKLQKHFKDWELWVADPPGTLKPWNRAEYIGAGLQDIWARKSENNPWQIQIMLFDAENDQWIFKRDESIRRDLRSTLINAPKGLKILAPEVQLLYKSKSLREKDRADFESALPALGTKQRLWLKQALEKIYQGRHSWIDKL